MPTAISYLSALINNEKKPNPVAYFYLGYTYHAQHDFKKAVYNYKLFLKKTETSNPNRQTVKDEILRCANAMKLVWQEKLAVVENMGEKVNTRFDEFAPIQSPNSEEKIYFASARRGNLGGLRDQNGILDDLRGNYSSDIFSASVHNGEWTNPTRLSNLVNSPQNDVVLDFNETGTAMYIFKGYDYFSGQILIDSFKPIEEKPLYPSQFISPIKAEKGDGTPFFFNDTTILFSSRIDGGFGGSDLYLIQFSNGKWSTPQNLGATINSPYDETTPYLANDGRTLYFSSNNVIGMGGFDIYQSKYNDFNKEWSEPINMGIPINSSKDDAYFRLNQDGTKGFFSSGRMDGLGGQDLYVAYFKTQRIEQLISSMPKGFHSIEFEELFNKENEEFVMSSDENFYKGELIDFELDPLFYDDDDDVLNEDNIQILKKIVNIVKEYPQIKIELVGNSDHNDPEQFALYFSIKRAEKVAQFLTENGIKPSHIFIKGCGSNFPIAKNDFGAVQNMLGERINKRIDIQLHDTRRTPLNIIVNTPKVEKAMAATKGIFYQRAIQGLSYKVQVAAIKQNYGSGRATLGRSLEPGDKSDRSRLAGPPLVSQ